MRHITETLQDIGGGMLLEELQDELTKLNQATTDTGKAGYLTLKISIKPAGNGKKDVKFDVQTKPPKYDRQSYTMWESPEGDLLAEDPRQQKLNLKHAEPAGAPTLKAVG